MSMPDFQARTIRLISDATLDVTDISKRLGKLDQYKVPGADAVHPWVLKSFADAFAIPLAKIYFRSIQEGKIPHVWRLANVTPLHKKGSWLDQANYRPASLTSVPCKVLEGIIRDALTDHLYAQDEALIAEQQHGFVRNKACVTNLLESADLISSSLAYKKWIDVILLDFAKAFDKVPHKRLALKLQAYDISGNLFNWICDFLSN